jgi:hypothetical protein
MADIVLVGGDWDETEGKRSSIFDNIVIGIEKSEVFQNIAIFNGGSFQKLEYAFRILNDNNIKAVLWMANISNDIPKTFVEQIKTNYPKIMFVSSKRNIDQKYTIQDIIAHGLNLKSNLILEIVNVAGIYEGRLLDPLGNLWCQQTADFESIGIMMATRLNQLMHVTRQATIHSPETPGEITEITIIKHFFKTIKEKAETFHELISPSKSTRFLGNASFRCERGFPSMRFKDGIYVSKRNVDKRYIDPSAFVHVGWNKDTDTIWYRGDNKPSVDTPIQVKLYNKLPDYIRFMLHSHVYVKNAPFTSKMIPCGGLEEVQEIMDVIIDCVTIEQLSRSFAINLKGHGSIIFAWHPSFIDEYEFYVRPIPELMI